VDPPVIHYDEKKFHMVVDSDRCLGSSCAQCLGHVRPRCPGSIPRKSITP
jgi:hypothetical protein